MHWNAWRTGAVVSFLSALAVGAFAVAEGEARLFLFFIIPVFYGTGVLGLASILLLVGAFVLWSVGTMRAFADAARRHERPLGSDPADPFARYGYRDEDRSFEARERLAREAHEDEEERAERRERRFRGGGVIMIGPIPIVMGTDKRLTLWLVLATLALMVLALAFILLAGGTVEGS